jgi:hypothetical protein
VRGFDRNYLKPFLLREKEISKDEKLLNTFKKINELNLNKMADNPDFILNSSSKNRRKSSVYSIESDYKP